MRNRDLQRLCFAEPAATPAEARRRSAWVSRKLRLLRAHGLIHKVTGTHRYHLTTAGRIATTARNVLVLVVDAASIVGAYDV